MNMPVHELRGPHADEACRLLSKVAALTLGQAQKMGEFYESENDARYEDFCTEVWNALERTERILPLGWFEAIFSEAEWVESTKALHAIADAVMATLVRQEISTAAYQMLTLPFLVGCSEIPETQAKIDLVRVQQRAALAIL